MNCIFNEIRHYAEKWNVKSERDFTPEEIKAVSEAVIVPSTYGNSVRFTMREGGITFIPVSAKSSLGAGEIVDLNDLKLITLGKTGETDIYRVDSK